jgi:hypothetical protein
MNEQHDRWPAFMAKPIAAEYCAQSVRALDYARSNGNLPFYSVGRSIAFSRVDLDAWMARFRVDPSEVSK